MTTVLPLMKSVLTRFAKSALLRLGLSLRILAADAAIQIGNYCIDNFKWRNGRYNENSLLEESGLLIKGISDTIKNEAKKEMEGFLPILLGTLAASMLRSTLTGRGVIRAGEGTIRAGENF